MRRKLGQFSGGVNNRIALFAKPRVLLVLVVILGILGASGSGGTLAYFTSTQTSTGNQFVAGSVTLNALTQDVITRVAGGGYMKPGDTVTGNMAVTNSGTIDSYYSLKLERNAAGDAAWTAFEGRATLTVWDRGSDGACPAAPGVNSGNTVVSAVTLASLLAATHNYSAGASTFTVPASYLFGNSTNASTDSTSTNGSAGARPLAASGTENWCFKLAMSVGSAPSSNSADDNAFKDVDATYKMTAFAAQQSGR